VGERRRLQEYARFLQRGQLTGRFYNKMISVKKSNKKRGTYQSKVFEGAGRKKSRNASDQLGFQLEAQGKEGTEKQQNPSYFANRKNEWGGKCSRGNS